MRAIFVEQPFTPPLSGDESLDIWIFGPPQYLIRSFEYDLALAQHQKSCVCDAKRVAFILKRHVSGSIDSVQRGESESVTHAVRDEDACHSLYIAQRNDQFINFLRRDRIQTRGRLIIKH